MGAGNVDFSIGDLGFDGSGSFYLAGGVVSASSSSQIVPCYWKDGQQFLLPLPSGRTKGNAYGLAFSAGAPVFSGWTAGTTVSTCTWTIGANPVDLPLPGGTGSYMAYEVAYDTAGRQIVAGFAGTSSSAIQPRIWEDGILSTPALPAGATKGSVLSLAFDASNNWYASGYYTDTSGSISCYWVQGTPAPITYTSGTYSAASSGGTVIRRSPSGSMYIAGKVGNSSSESLPCYWKDGALNMLTNY
jgi:hypothetical protein